MEKKHIVYLVGGVVALIVSIAFIIWIKVLLTGGDNNDKFGPNEGKIDIDQKREWEVSLVSLKDSFNGKLGWVSGLLGIAVAAVSLCVVATGCHHVWFRRPAAVHRQAQREADAGQIEMRLLRLEGELLDARTAAV